MRYASVVLGAIIVLNIVASATAKAQVAISPQVRADILKAHNIAGVDGRETPKTVEPRGQGHRFAPVGFVRSETTEGVGALVGPCLMLTAHHVVFRGMSIDRSEGRAAAIRFQIGDPAEWVVGHPVLWGNYEGVCTLHADGKQCEAIDDWAFVEFEGEACKGDDYGWFKLSEAPARALEGRQVFILGAGAEQGHVTVNTATVRRYPSGDEMLALQLDGKISHGDSGSPAVVPTSNGFEIIGIAQVQSLIAGERATPGGLRIFEANKLYCPPSAPMRQIEGSV